VELKDASNDMAKHCDASFFIRVDDDMYLHPQALAYVARVCSMQPAAPMVAFRLYDTALKTADWCGTVKAYSTEICKDYTFEDPGDWSMDLRFMRYLGGNSMQWQLDESVLGVHANLPKAEYGPYMKKTRERYPQLELAGRYKFWPEFSKFNYSADKQHKHSVKLVTQANTEAKTDFGAFIASQV